MTWLPGEVRHEMERFFDADFAGVRVHVGAEARARGVAAFARGEGIHFAPGQFQPGTREGRGLIAHELTHVLQQRDGRVPPLDSHRPCLVEDPVLEAEAELAAERWLRGEPHALLARHPGVFPPSGPRAPVMQPTRVVLKDPSKTTYSPIKNAYEKYLFDYELFQKWLTNPKEYVPALQALEKELTQSFDDAENREHRLTRILLKREQMYGINATGAPAYTGVLSGAEFVAMSKKGVLPKDHVTPEHGEYTHRLQWYILLYKMTQGFVKQPSATCYHSPLLLLKGTTDPAYKPPRANWPVPEGMERPTTGNWAYESQFGSLWEALFDRRPFKEVFSVAEDGLTCPEMFTALLVAPASNVSGLAGYHNLVGGNTLTDKCPVLSMMVTTRYLKRAGEQVTSGSSWPAWYSAKKTTPSRESSEEVEVVIPSKYDFLTYKTKGETKTSTQVLMPKPPTKG